MKYNLEQIFINYRGSKVRLIERYHNGSVEVLLLDTGALILPAHFKYGFAKIPDISTLFKLYYPADAAAHLIHRSNPLFELIPKDSHWKGSIIPIPFKP
jgi:hypothetical protein